MKVLILGGYGIFGGRAAQLLAVERGLSLVIAGRSLEKAQILCDALPPGAARQAVRFDRDSAVGPQIAAVAPDVVVDCTGPFQLYGDDPYRVVRACIECGVSYLDLADGSAFVKGIGRFDDEARARNIFILSGVSSFPVLTSAVIRHLSSGLKNVHSVCAGIAPSPYAIVGLNVIRAIASYAGQPIPLLRNGKQTVGHALVESMRYTVAPPGYLPLRSTRFSLVDVPDLQLLPEVAPGVKTLWIGAGPVPEVLHLCLNGLAWLVRWKLLPSLTVFAPLFHFVINVLRWGEHRGGMFIAIEGESEDGKKIERSWHLLAEGEDGPFIPSMAVQAIIRNCLRGRQPDGGARPALRELELADYEAIFRDRTIYTGCRGTSDEDRKLPLYHRMLGEAWTTLPAQIRVMHDFTSQSSAEGWAVIERGKGIMATMIASLFSFPKAGRNVPVTVVFKSVNGGELWQRSFADKIMTSFQEEGQGRFSRLLVERFGPVAIGLALVIDNEKLRLIVRRWSVFGIPLPASWAPSGESYETVTDGIFSFNVEIAHPLTGLIVSYRGRLTRKESA